MEQKCDIKVLPMIIKPKLKHARRLAGMIYSRFQGTFTTTSIMLELTINRPVVVKIPIREG